MKRVALISVLVAAIATLTVLAQTPVRRAATSPAKPTSVDVTVREGTSMSVAISPDGRTLATDMQGSIWTMPAGGGAMTRITDVFNDARSVLGIPGLYLYLFVAWAGVIVIAAVNIERPD